MLFKKRKHTHTKERMKKERERGLGFRGKEKINNGINNINGSKFNNIVVIVASSTL